MKKVIFFFLFAFAITSTFALSTPNDLTCAEPTNITNTSSLAGSISFTWDGCMGCCNGYEVQYVRLSDGYTSPLYSTASSSITLTGLASGEYEFYFRTVCDGGVSGFIVVEDNIWT